MKSAADTDCVIAGRPTVAAKGNILEAINLASSQFAQDYIDRDLVRTGISLVIITAGSAVFEVDYDVLKLTTETLVGNGIGIDLVALSPMPLHSVPLFKYRLPLSAREAMAQASSNELSRLGRTPRDVSSSSASSWSPHEIRKHPINDPESPEKAHLQPLALTSDWSYALPHWIDVSFWFGETLDTDWQDTQKVIRRGFAHGAGIFRSTCRMYELETMGLMDIEVADISIPLLQFPPCPPIRLDNIRSASGEGYDIGTL